MEDKRCHDPFNYSIYKHEMPPTKPCEGCCVKMVQFIGTGINIFWIEIFIFIWFKRLSIRFLPYVIIEECYFSEHYQIKRTCTDDFEVNFFMVNHACMTEGHRHGHMCFCEEDECNSAMPMSKSIFSSNQIIPAQALGSFLNVVFGINPFQAYQDHLVAAFVSLSLLTFYQVIHSNLLSCSLSSSSSPSSSSMLLLKRDPKVNSKSNHAGKIINSIT